MGPGPLQHTSADANNCCRLSATVLPMPNLTIHNELVRWCAEGDADYTIIETEAIDVAATLNFRPAPVASIGVAATVDLSPGNGFRYRLIVTRLADPTLPGNLLISWPEKHTCVLLNHITGGGLHTPSYVDEKMDVGAQHAHVIAAFTTLLCANLP